MTGVFSAKGENVAHRPYGFHAVSKRTGFALHDELLCRNENACRMVVLRQGFWMTVPDLH